MICFRCKVIIFLTSVTPHVIMISSYSGVRSEPRFFSSLLNRPIIMSISTTSCIVSIVIFISIPTLTPVPISPLGILSVILSHITSSIVIIASITWPMAVPSASWSISIIWSLIVSIFIIPSITTLISSSAKGSIPRCKILLTRILISGSTLIYLWFVLGLFSNHSHFHVAY